MKEIVIVMLVLVNIALMVFIANREQQERSTNKYVLQQQQQMLWQQRQLQQDADGLNALLGGQGVVRAFGVPDYRLMPDGTIVAPPISPHPLQTEWALTVIGQ
jgi:hypothetical protein